MDIYRQIAITVLKIMGLSALSFFAIAIAILILIYLAGLVKAVFCSMFLKKDAEKEQNDEET